MRVLVVFGTRPEAIKLAPVVDALRDHGSFEPLVVVTAQHRQMLDQVLELFEIEPHFDLNIMTAGQSLTDIATNAMSGLTPLMRELRPDVVLVQGDTTTTFAAALAAFYGKVPVGHVEAGLRTHDLTRPFPEEGNRQLTTRIARWHFAPTEAARENLLLEGIDPKGVFVTGNTVVDALRKMKSRPFKFTPGPIQEALESGRRLILVTAHRRENWGRPIEQVCQAILELLSRFADIHVLFATHLNPLVADSVHSALGAAERVDLIGPQEYLQFLALMDRAHLILSDSGGVQEEAPSLGTPVLVLRDVTERPEAVDAGVVRLVGTECQRIVAEASRLLEDPDAYAAMTTAANPFGDGTAAHRIVRILAEQTT